MKTNFLDKNGWSAAPLVGGRIRSIVGNMFLGVGNDWCDYAARTLRKWKKYCSTHDYAASETTQLKFFTFLLPLY